MSTRLSVRFGAVLAAGATAAVLAIALSSSAGAGPPYQLNRISSDPFADGIGYHASEVEPSIAAWGNTIVATFQVGRVYDGGGSDVGVATSTNGGESWKAGQLPLTVQGGGPAGPDADHPYYPLTRASDTVVAYDAKHGVWLINTLGITGNAHVPGVFVNVSTDGVHWSQPIVTHTTATTADSPDKNWITCDNWPQSKGYGNCYIEYDNNGNGNRLLMQVSSDGGQTWTQTGNAAPGNGNTGDVSGETALASASSPGDTNVKVASVSNLSAGDSMNVDIDPSGGNQETVTVTAVGTAGAGGTGVTFTPALTRAHVQGAPVARAAATPTGTTGAIGGVPLVQPPTPGAAPGSVCGRVVVPYAGGGGISYVSSSDCGAHWSAHTQILPNMTQTHTVNGSLRTSLLPADAMDGSGAIYLVWQTRSFRAGSVSSTPNDIALSVMAAPTDVSQYPAFGPPARIPIDEPADTTNPVDHFIPGIAADPATSGANAHLGLYYYFYPTTPCVFADPTGNQCDLSVGYISSVDGGQSWGTPLTLAHMTLADVARTSQGPMVGDYSQATVIASGKFAGKSISAFAVGSTDNALHEDMYVPGDGLAITGGVVRLENPGQAEKDAANSAPPEEHPLVPPSN